MARSLASEPPSSRRCRRPGAERRRGGRRDRQHATVATGICTNEPCRLDCRLDEHLERRRCPPGSRPEPSTCPSTASAALAPGAVGSYFSLTFGWFGIVDVEVLDVLRCERLLRLRVERERAEDDRRAGCELVWTSRRSMLTVCAATKSGPPSPPETGRGDRGAAANAVECDRSEPRRTRRRASGSCALLPPWRTHGTHGGHAVRLPVNLTVKAPLEWS